MWTTSEGRSSAGGRGPSNPPAFGFAAAGDADQRRQQQRQRHPGDGDDEKSPSSAASAIAWDPTSPALLTVPFLETSTGTTSGAAPGTNAGDGDGPKPTPLNLNLNSVPCCGGVGCNPHETTALLELLDARDDATDALVGTSAGPSPERSEVLLSLSKQYRRSLTECLQRWEEDEDARAAEAEAEAEGPDGDDDQPSLELLKLMLPVTYLSEIFLLPRPADSGPGVALAGSLTADTVRYLRYSHLSTEPFLDGADLVDGADVEAMFGSDQPEYWGSGGGSPGGNGQHSAYWRMVRRLVSRGLVDDAWSALSRHSMCRDDGPIEDRRGFAHLYALLRSAPLPGGRTGRGDDNLGDDGDDEEEGGDDDDDGASLGIPANAWRGWDFRGAGLHAAQSYWNEWSASVVDAAREGGPGLEGGLLRRIPHIRWAVLDVLSGRAAIESHESWAEALCSELLYRYPSIQPDDISVRTEAVMTAFHQKRDERDEGAPSASDAYDAIVLAIMNRNAGKALDALHSFGGGSGAALPVTMTSLLCDLLVFARRVPKTMSLGRDSSGEIELNLRCELFLSAASACEASFNAIGQGEVGVRCASRLLLLDGSSRTREALYDLICRRIPSSDAETKAMTLICTKHPALRQAGSTIALARARHYLRDLRPGGAAYWMLRGAEVEAGPNNPAPHGEEDGKTESPVANARGVASARLGVLCAQATSQLVKLLVDDADEQMVAHAGAAAGEIVDAIREDEALGVLDSISSSSFQLLSRVTELAAAFGQKRDSDAGTIIASCLEDRVDSRGVVRPLAHRTMWFDFLKLSFSILKRDEVGFDEASSNLVEDGLDHSKNRSSFSVGEIRALMSRFKALETSYDADVLFQEAGIDLQSGLAFCDEMEGGGDEGAIPFSIGAMRLMLGRGLMRAIVEQNAEQKEITTASRIAREREEASLHSPPLLGGNERFVDLLLAPPMCKM